MQRYEGIIKSWKEEKGFGFIQNTNASQDIFIHIRDLKHANYQPKLGDIVSFRIVAEKGGKLRAYDAHIQGQEISDKLRKKTFKKSNLVTKNTISKYRLGMPLILIIATSPFVFSVLLFKENYNIIPFFAYLSMSFIIFFVYAYDKTMAHKNKWRVPELNLHLLAFLGGWPGALITQHTIRHKNKKTSFQATTWLIVIFHLAIWTYIVFFKSAVIGNF
ncbi:MAG: cold shock and DUF1294 domain-containing protein [Methylococcales bacterium]|nr:cold shock and DUF1294 domain-containing protein [Methylococcales bacterium]